MPGLEVNGCIACVHTHTKKTLLRGPSNWPAPRSFTGYIPFLGCALFGVVFLFCLAQESTQALVNGLFSEEGSVRLASVRLALLTLSMTIG